MARKPKPTKLKELAGNPGESASMAERQRRSIGLREALVVLGLASLFYGAWLIYRPAAFNVAGATLLSAALYGADAENRRAAWKP